jgi:hypothetical protein
MSRIVPSNLLAALAQPTVEPFYAVEFLFDTAPVRLWTGYGERTINGSVYTGAGNLLSLDGLEEVSDLSARDLTINLSGISSSIVSLALQEQYQRRRCRVYFGVIGVEDVVEVFAGSINSIPIEDSGETSLIVAQVDSKLVETEKASNRRYTSESQKSRYPGDTFFDYVGSIQDAQIVWGRTSG